MKNNKFQNENGVFGKRERGLLYISKVLTHFFYSQDFLNFNANLSQIQRKSNLLLTILTFKEKLQTTKQLFH